jgi:hypothetical protein
MKAVAKPAANVHFRKDGIGDFSGKPVTPVAPPVTLSGLFWPAPFGSPNLKAWARKVKHRPHTPPQCNLGEGAQAGHKGGRKRQFQGFNPI